MEPGGIQPHHQIPGAAVLRLQPDAGQQQGGGGVRRILRGVIYRLPLGLGRPVEHAPVRGQVLGDGAAGGVAAHARNVIQVKDRQIPPAVRGVKEQIVYLDPAAHPGAKSVDGRLAVHQALRRAGDGLPDAVQALAEHGGLLRHVLPGLVLHPQACDLHHQRRADQQRDQGGQQHGRKEPVAEGTLQRLHCAPSFTASLQAFRISLRLRAAQGMS